MASENLEHHFRFLPRHEDRSEQETVYIRKGPAMLAIMRLSTAKYLFYLKISLFSFRMLFQKEMFLIYDNKHRWNMNSNPGPNSVLCLQSYGKTKFKI